MTKIGVSPPFATTCSTSSASGSTPAVPSAAPFATPITVIGTPPHLRLPVPVINPAALVFTSWPSGNKPLRISSSVMVGFLDTVRECGQILAVHIADCRGIFDTQDSPHRNGVIARTELLLTRRQPFLFRLHRLEIEARNLGEHRFGRGAKPVHRVLGESVSATYQPPVFAAVGTPYQRFVLRVEFLDSLVRLDYLRAGDTDPPLFGDHDAGASRRRQAGTAERTGLAANQRDHGDARAAGLNDCSHQLGHSKLARVRLLQTYSTAVQQQQDGLGQLLVIASRAHQPQNFGAADLTEGAAHELAFLRRDEDIFSLQLAAPDDDPVVKCRRQVEHFEVRALDTLGWSDELRETARIQQARDTLACGRIEPAALASSCGIFHQSASMSAEPCIRRR